MEKKDKITKLAFYSLLLNIAYSAYHIIWGIKTHSWWFFTIGIYYAILSTSRFVILRHRGKNRCLIRFTGIMLMALAISLVGTVILAFVKDRGTVFPLVAMLAIATYTFTKITLAAIKWVQARKSTSAKTLTLRNISFANAFVSIFSLQRSMLVSFAGMSETNIQIMNAATGCGVCIIVFLLGLSLITKMHSHL